MSNPAVTFGCCLLASMVGRSSFHNGPLRARQPLQILRVLRIWGVGLLISSSENDQNANFGEFYECEVRRIPIPRTPVNKGKKRRAGVCKPRPSTCAIPERLVDRWV